MTNVNVCIKLFIQPQPQYNKIAGVCSLPSSKGYDRRFKASRAHFGRTNGKQYKVTVRKII